MPANHILNIRQAQLVNTLYAAASKPLKQAQDRLSKAAVPKPYTEEGLRAPRGGTSVCVFVPLKSYNTLRSEQCDLGDYGEIGKIMVHA